MHFLQKFLFNIWYYRHPPWDTNISPPELIEFIRDHPPGRALDLGCGTGTNVITLAQHGWRVTGIDFVRKAIHIARRKAKAANVTADFRVGDVTRVEELPGPFDLILDIGCFHSLTPQDRKVYIENLRHILVPGGHFLLYTMIKTTPDSSGPGVAEADLEIISTRMNLISRENGTNRGRRASTWITYQRPIATK